MGLDATIYADGAVTGAELKRANAYMHARFGVADYDGVWLARDQHVRDRIVVNTLSRYYGPGYERGDWPAIYALIRATEAALPGTIVHYGSDSDYEKCPEVTPTEMARIWDHWLGDNWNAYRVPRR